MKHITPVELRAWQKARGLSARKMCGLLHISDCTYSRWVNGRQPTPRWLAQWLDRLALQYPINSTTAATTKQEGTP